MDTRKLGNINKPHILYYNRNFIGSFESDHQQLSYLDLSTSWSKDLYNTIMGTVTSDLLNKQNNSIIVVEFKCSQVNPAILSKSAIETFLKRAAKYVQR